MRALSIGLGLVLIALGVAGGWELIHVQHQFGVPVLLFVAGLVLAGGICIDRSDLLGGLKAAVPFLAKKAP